MSSHSVDDAAGPGPSSTRAAANQHWHHSQDTDPLRVSKLLLSGGATVRVGCPMGLRVANSSRLAGVATSLPAAHSPMQVSTVQCPGHAIQLPAHAMHRIPRLLAGLAGAISRTATAPIDRLKMLLQVQEDAKGMSLREGMQKMAAEGQ